MILYWYHLTYEFYFINFFVSNCNKVANLHPTYLVYIVLYSPDKHIQRRSKHWKIKICKLIDQLQFR